MLHNGINRAFSIPFAQAQEKFLQRLNLVGRGGVLAVVFFDDAAQVRLENALGALQGVGGIGGRF